MITRQFEGVEKKVVKEELGTTGKQERKLAGSRGKRVKEHWGFRE